MSLLRLDARPEWDRSLGIIYVIYVVFPSGEDDAIEITKLDQLEDRLSEIGEALDITTVQRHDMVPTPDRS